MTAHHPMSSLACLLLAAMPLAGPAHCQCDPQWQNGDPISSPLGEVAGTALWDPDGPGPLGNVLLVVGHFDVAMTHGVTVATFDGTTWNVLESSLATPTAVTVWNGQPVVAFGSNLKTWNGSSWTQIGSALGTVYCFAVYQGDLIAGGYFSAINGGGGSGLARFDGTTWSSVGGGVSGQGTGSLPSPVVRALAVYTWQNVSSLYVGGQFTTAGGVGSPNLAVWNGSAWSALPTPNAEVRAMAVRLTAAATTSYLFVGGAFTSIGSVAAQRVGRYVAATNTWSAMGTSLTTTCEALLARNVGLSGYEVVAGTPSMVWRWSGSAWNSLGSGGSVRSLAYYGGRYIAAFQQIALFESLWAFEAGSLVPLRGAGIAGNVISVLPTANDTVIGGDFTTISGTVVNGVARGSPGAWQPIGNGVTGGNGAVNALARLPNGDFVAAGYFTVQTGGVADSIARWDGAAWVPMGAGINGTVYCLVVAPNGDLVAGGFFSAAGTVLASNVARWNGSVWSAMDVGPSGVVYALALTPWNGDVVAGGSFARAGLASTLVNNLTVFSSGHWNAIAGGVNASVYALTTRGDSLMVGGAFSSAAGQNSVGLAEYHFTLLPFAGPQLQFNAQVRSLCSLPNGDLLVGGGAIGFPQGSGFVNDHVGRLTGYSWTPLDCNSEYEVHALAKAPNGDVLATGMRAGGYAISAGVGRWAPTCPATATPYGGSCSPLLLAAPQLPWLGTTYTTQLTGITPGSILFTVTGLTATSVPLSTFTPIATPGCNLLVDAISTQLLVANGGVAVHSINLPTSVAFVGLPVHEQVLQMTLGAGGALTGFAASNGLQAVLGTY